MSGFDFVSNSGCATAYFEFRGIVKVIPPELALTWLPAPATLVRIPSEDAIEGEFR